MAYRKHFRILCLLICLFPTRVSPEPITVALGFGFAMAIAQIGSTVAYQFLDYYVMEPIFGPGSIPARRPGAPLANVTGTNISQGPNSQLTLINTAPVTNIAHQPAPEQNSSLSSFGVGNIHLPRWKAVALSLYVAAQARLMQLAYYLSRPERPSTIFSQYTLDELLSMPTDMFQDLLRDYLVDTYTITNQETLKLGFIQFLKGIDAEIAALKEYQRYCTVGEKVGAVNEQINHQVQGIVGAVIPFIGPLFAKIPLPTVDQFFYLKRDLKIHINERVSKLLFLRTTFLQTSFSV